MRKSMQLNRWQPYRQDAEQAQLAAKKVVPLYQNDAREAERKAREILYTI